MHLLQDFVSKAKLYLKSNAFDDFGNLLNESWQLKKELSNKITTDEINQIYDKALKNGALGGKILGAGGGGFFLFYIKKKFYRKI